MGAVSVVGRQAEQFGLDVEGQVRSRVKEMRCLHSQEAISDLCGSGQGGEAGSEGVDLADGAYSYKRLGY